MNAPSWVDDYVSIPYEELNCWQLIQLIYKEIYQIDLTGIEDQRGLIRSGFWQEVTGGYQASDILLFKECETSTHVGFLLDNTYMLHADQSCGSVIERWTAPNWSPRQPRVYRCKLLA